MPCLIIPLYFGRGVYLKNFADEPALFQVDFSGVVIGGVPFGGLMSVVVSSRRLGPCPRNRHQKQHQHNPKETRPLRVNDHGIFVRGPSGGPKCPRNMAPDIGAPSALASPSLKIRIVHRYYTIWREYWFFNTKY